MNCKVRGGGDNEEDGRGKVKTRRKWEGVEGKCMRVWRKVHTGGEESGGGHRGKKRECVDVSREKSKVEERIGVDSKSGGETEQGKIGQDSGEKKGGGYMSKFSWPFVTIQNKMYGLASATCGKVCQCLKSILKIKWGAHTEPHAQGAHTEPHTQGAHTEPCIQGVHTELHTQCSAMSSSRHTYTNSRHTRVKWQSCLEHKSRQQPPPTPATCQLYHAK